MPVRSSSGCYVTATFIAIEILYRTAHRGSEGRVEGPREFAAGGLRSRGTSLQGEFASGGVRPRGRSLKGSSLHGEFASGGPLFMKLANCRCHWSTPSLYLYDFSELRLSTSNALPTRAAQQHVEPSAVVGHSAVRYDIVENSPKKKEIC